MLPIVNGLEEDYSQTVTFLYLNAATDGAEAFQQLGLRGHPAYVLFDADGTRLFTTLGVQDEAILRQSLEGAINDD